MKKILLITAIGLNGLVSAAISERVEKKDSPVYHDNLTDASQEVRKAMSDNCHPVTYVLSCGERIDDTYCDYYDEIECDIMDIWDAWDHELC